MEMESIIFFLSAFMCCVCPIWSLNRQYNKKKLSTFYYLLYYNLSS